jgi:hypothetical protein
MAARALVALVSAVVALAFAASASAGWALRRAVPGAGGDTMAIGFPALAVGGGGRAAVGWVDDGGAGRRVRHPAVAVRVSFRRADGTFETRTLSRRRDLAARGLTIAVDRRGEVTVAWIDARPRGPGTVRAAYRTTPADRRFAAITVTPAPATELRLRVIGAGRAIAVGFGAGCSTTELLAGPIEAATLTRSTVARRQTVYASAGPGLVLSGAFGGGAEASWTTFPPTASGGTTFPARMTNGTFGPAGAPPSARVAVESNAAADQVVFQRRPENYGPSTGDGARPAGSGVVDPAPLPAGGSAVAAGSGYGAARALAVVGFTTGALRMASWSPVG